MRPARAVPAGVGVAGVGLALGALTSWAQGLLPGSWNSLANSASGWTVVTVLLVAPVVGSGVRSPRGAQAPRAALAAVLGAVGFVTLVLGYTLASYARGLTYDPTFWGAIGVLIGPFVGLAVAWTLAPDRPWRCAVGAGGIAGVLVGDGLYGLTVVLDTTGPAWWVTSIVLGVLLAAAVAVRLRSPSAVAIETATTAIVAAGLLAAFSVLS